MHQKRIALNWAWFAYRSVSRFGFLTRQVMLEQHVATFSMSLSVSVFAMARMSALLRSPVL